MVNEKMNISLNQDSLSINSNYQFPDAEFGLIFYNFKNY